MKRDICLWAVFVAVFLAGIGIAAIETAWRLIWGCPDFTDSQSGAGGDQVWVLLPPGPECRTTVHYAGMPGTHVDYPSWARLLAILAWVGWLATIAAWGWSRHQQRTFNPGANR